MDMNKSAVAVIEDDAIVIRVAISALPQAVEAGCGMHYIAGNWVVTDELKLATEMVYALNDEQEDGTTPIHRLLDKAVEHVLENGGEGIEEAPAEAVE